MSSRVTAQGAGSPTRHYECAACGFRVTAGSRMLVCPDCGATLTNISVPRE